MQGLAYSDYSVFWPDYFEQVKRLGGISKSSKYLDKYYDRACRSQKSLEEIDCIDDFDLFPIQPNQHGQATDLFEGDVPLRATWLALKPPKVCPARVCPVLYARVHAQSPQTLHIMWHCARGHPSRLYSAAISSAISSAISEARTRWQLHHKARYVKGRPVKDDSLSIKVLSDIQNMPNASRIVWMWLAGASSSRRDTMWQYVLRRRRFSEADEMVWRWFGADSLICQAGCT